MVGTGHLHKIKNKRKIVKKYFRQVVIPRDDDVLFKIFRISSNL